MEPNVAMSLVPRETLHVEGTRAICTTSLGLLPTRWLHYYRHAQLHVARQFPCTCRLVPPTTVPAGACAHSNTPPHRHRHTHAIEQPVAWRAALLVHVHVLVAVVLWNPTPINCRSTITITMPLKPFTLTHVVYSTDDALGPIWSLLTLAPPFCVVSLTTTIIIGRDLRAAFVLVGLVLTWIISTILKKLIDEPRPERSEEEDGLLNVPSSQEEGMPSNHSAFVAFAAIFAWLFAFRRCDRMQGYALWVRAVKRWLPPLGASVIAIGCSYSRIHLGYHTTNQVSAGVGLGLVLGGIWYYLYETVYVTGLAPFLEQLLSSFDFCSPHEVGDTAAERRKGLDARRKLDAQRQNGSKKR